MEENEEGYEELTEVECEAAAKVLSEDSAQFAKLYTLTEGITAKRWQIHLESSRRLAAMDGTMPDLEYIRRLRVDELYSLAAFVPRRTAQAVWRHFHAAQPSG